MAALRLLSDADDSNGVGGITGADDAAFAFTVNSTTGVLSVVQYSSRCISRIRQAMTRAFSSTPVRLVGQRHHHRRRWRHRDQEAPDVSATIRFDDDGPSTSANTAAVQLDDDAMPGGNPGGVGDVTPDTGEHHRDTGAHLWRGRRWHDAADDDGSGSAVGLQRARSAATA